MDRRQFLKTGALAAGALAIAPDIKGWIPSHNWDKYDFGSGPEVKDRLYQGPFPQYAPEDFFGGSVIQYTTPGKQLINCYGMGLTSYISGDLGAPIVPGKSLEQTIDELFAFPLATKVYIRPIWRHIQKKEGKLDFDDYWKITMEKAEKYGKRVGFRIMLNNPDILDNALPDFVLDKVPLHKLKGEWKGNPSQVRYQHEHLQPEYQNDYFLKYYEEMMQLLAEKYNGSPLIEYMDTSLYGFWGEGHTWPYDGNAFPDQATAEKTFLRIWDIQNKYWTKVPLVTNTQPDYSKVGNSEILDRTIRSNNWIRTDTIFIENEQIEALSNRPEWTAAIVECAISDGFEETMRRDSAGIPYSEAVISHVKDVGANYFSLWTFHKINADHLHRYYNACPDGLNDLSHSLGFRIRPSWIWHSECNGRDNLIFGMVNDGISGVPGVLRLTIFSDDGKVCESGCLDAGYPHPRGVRQAMITLPSGTPWRDGYLKLKAELEVKGVRHPIPFATAQVLNPDGSLTIKQHLND
ncbi:MAG: twin-arginine translocation signal domain-containing protein [Bacteroidaceae bacterium]|nr:twin-arginine translocation signal domain-containing protein [Bacteroidaceae bacterium]